MDDAELVLRAINLFASALVVGGMAFAHMVLVPLIRQWDDYYALNLHRDTVVVNPDRYIRPAAITSLVTAGAAILVADDLPDDSLWLTVAGIGLLLGVALVSEALNQPINRHVKQQGEGALAVYRGLAETWGRANALRTLIGLGGLGCYIVGALLAV